MKICEWDPLLQAISVLYELSSGYFSDSNKRSKQKNFIVPLCTWKRYSQLASNGNKYVTSIESTKEIQNPPE